MAISKKTRELIADINDKKLTRLQVKFDITTLNMIIAFLYKESVLRTRRVATNINKLFSSLDEDEYKTETELTNRIWVIQKTSEFLLKREMTNSDFLKIQLKDDPECDQYREEIIDESSEIKISYDDSKYLIRKIDDILEFGYIVTVKQVFQEILDSIDANDYKSYRAVSDELNKVSNAIVNLHRRMNSLESDQTFSLSDDVFETVVTDAVNKLKDRNKIFTTGIRALNTILSPGYMSKRLYVYLAFPGGGKSQILLKTALDIRKYNSHVKPKDSNKRPAVLFLTLENGVEETIERIYNMTCSSEDIRNVPIKQIIKQFKTDGELTLNEKNNMDIIIKYYDNRKLSTDDLYGMIQDMDDEGIEVVALIIDYVKRLKPAEKANSEKEELKNITNELKTIANFFDIPVITAQQLNRVSASVVDAAMQSNKEDLAKLIGRDGVAGAWEIIENADFVCILNQEIKRDTDQLYMTFKMMKRRYRSTENSEKKRRMDYFNQPYVAGNDIRLMDDVELDRSLALISLASDMASYEDKKRGKKNATKRGKDEVKVSGYNDETDQIEFSPWDETTSEY